MKKLFLTLLLFGCVCLLKSQTIVYVIFTSTNSETKGVWNSIGKKTGSVREARHYFTLFDRAGGNKEQSYFYDFIYENSKEKPDTPAFYAHQSILDTKTVIDWNLVTSKQEAKEKYDYILSHDKIYFIDKKESTGSTIKIYPVELLKFNYY